MKKHIRFITFMLALTLAATLTSCWLLEDPFGEGSNPSHNDSTICDVCTDSSVCPMPPETMPDYGTEPVETTPHFEETTSNEGVPVDPVPDIRTLWGTVVEYEAVEPMEGVIAVRVYTDGGRVTMHLSVDNPSDYCVGDEVVFTYDANCPMDSYDGHSVWEAITIEYAPVAVPEKPVIYLYPETPTEVSVKLTIDGALTCTYPAYDKGWDSFTAHPDGTLIFPDEKEYYCLYWEGIQNMDCDFTRGFCVKGSDTAAFLEWALSAQGLTSREANEFIIYWLPRMESNPYNVISFQTESYTKGALLEIDPNPDSLLRVFMAYYPSDEAVEIEAQAFTPFERVGFAVVEWGGSELTKAP